MNWWRMAWRQLWRDTRSGELRLLVAAVVLGLASLSSVGFLADRIQAGLQRNAGELLGGDVVVVSDQPLPPAFLSQAGAEGLHGVTTLGFPTMVRAAVADPGSQGGAPRSRLVALKAVEPGYPLRGRLQVAAALADGGVPSPVRAVQDIPARGEVWAEPGLFDALGLQVGDDVWLGNSRLHMSRVLVREPDRGVGFMNFAPRVMMNRADLDATGLVQPASRIAWRLALVGEASAVARYRAWAEAECQRDGVHGVRVESLESGRPEMRQTLDRADRFLRLVALLAALLSAVAVALAARAFAARRLDDCAMLRVLGVSQRDMAWAYVSEFVIVGLVAGLFGVALGYAIHGVFVVLLAGLIDVDLPAAGWRPALQGLGMGMTLLLAFGLPPVLQLARVPALRVLRRELGDVRADAGLVWAFGLVGFVALLLAASGDLRLGVWVVAGFAGAALLFALLAWLALRVLRGTVREDTAPSWLLLATRQLTARPAYAVLQVGALALGLLALLLLLLLRTDLIDSWRQATPVDAPNRFVINIQPWQIADFEAYLHTQGVGSFDVYPMVRGRLIAVNGQAVTPEQYQEERAQRLVDREFNLSYALTPPAHNTLVAGDWGAGEAGTLSLEEGIAKTLNIGLGDVLRFDMAGLPPYEARVTSLRKVDWASMRVNFFVMFPLDTLGPVPMTYITAFRAPPRVSGAPSFDNGLLARFPNVTNLDVGATLDQVQSVLTQVSRAVEFLFLFTLAAGLVVLVATVTATREARAREYAVLRALGATERLLRRMQTAELTGVGALAGVLAAGMALLIGWGLAKFVFDFDWQPRFWVLWAGCVVGAALAWLAGWWGLRDVLRRPVAQTLRQAGL